MLVESKIDSICGRSLSSMKREYLSTLKEWRNAQIDVLRQKQPLTDEDQDRWFKKIQEDQNQVIFSLLDHNDEFIGYCGLTNIDYDHKRAELSFLVSPKRRQDRPVYRIDFLSVLYMMCTYLFEELKLHKLHSETYAIRHFTLSVMEEFGMKQGGVMKDHVVINGAFCDSFVHDFLEEDWVRTKNRVKEMLQQEQEQ